MRRKKLLTPEQVAEHLVVAERTVYEWLRSGRLRGIKVGRLWRVREKDLEAVRRGLEDVRAGRYVTLEAYDQGKRP